MQKNQIDTERLHLREITEQDAFQIVQWRKNPMVYKFFRSPHELSYDEHMKWYKEIYMEDDAQIHFISEEKTKKKSIGVFSVRKTDASVPCVEVSYLLDEAAQGHGYAPEAVLGMLMFAQEKWGVEKAIAEIHKDNVASQKMIQRIKFKESKRDGNFIIYERLSVSGVENN